MSLKNLLTKAKNIGKLKQAGISTEEMQGGFNEIPFHINIRTPRKEVLLTTLKDLVSELESLDTSDIPDKLIKKVIMEAFTIAFSQDKRATGVFHPSAYSIETKHCYRKMYYEYADIPKDATFIPITHDNRMQRLFDLGTMVHLYIQYNLLREGILIDFEAPINEPKYGVSGKADGLIEFSGFDHNNVYHPKETMILEVKTMFSFGFNKLDEPKEAHVNQASIYGHFLGVDKIAFVYYSKDTSELKIFVHDVDHAYAESFKANTRKVITKYSSNVRKHRTKDVSKHTETFDRVCRSRSSKRAMDCPYADYCFKN
jgi:hypothetical protein